MAYTFTLECARCNFGKQFHLNRRLQCEPIDAVLDRMHHRRRHRIQQAIEGQEITRSECEHRLFRCPKCNDIREAFYVKVTYNGDQVIETLYRCKVCKQQLISLAGPQDTTETPCPKCHEKALRIALVINDDAP